MELLTLEHFSGCVNEPFATRLDDPTDRYGRTLAIVKRADADGGEDRLADFMRDEGGARWYDGGLRGGWC